ncbi:hypothetical protein ACFOET_13280 [Parapedobacter deserti]|uniref:Uncharacterized protein n=1 Tax=Parapedobacter deserti TaxID=1912957 RepID=A0ABV7JR67_9SPHI
MENLMLCRYHCHFPSTFPLAPIPTGRINPTVLPPYLLTVFNKERAFFNTLGMVME